MKFANPIVFLYMLWIIPALVIFWIFVMRKKQRILNIFIESSLWKHTLNSLDKRRELIKILLLSFSIIFITIAFTRPQIGFRWKETKQQGVDILFAVDTSNSMLAEDIKPNRLERTKLAIRSLVSRLSGDRIGLIAFSGTAFLQSPLTVDYDGFLLTLDDIDTEILPRGGTSITKAIEEAIEAYDKVEKSHRVLVLISDGEDTDGDAISAAKKAKDNNIKIFTIGVGSKKGVPIPFINEEGREVFLKDRDGNTIYSRLNEKLLQEISFITEGAYIRSSSGEFGLDTLYKERLSKIKKRKVEIKKHKEYNERFQIPLFIALLLLIFEMFLSKRKLVS